MAGTETNYTVARCITAGELMGMIDENFTPEEKERMTGKFLKLTILHDDSFQELQSDKTLDSQGVTDGMTINLIVADPIVYIAAYENDKIMTGYRALEHQINAREKAQNSDEINLDICVKHPKGGDYCVTATFHGGIGDWILTTQQGKKYIMWDQNNQKMLLKTKQAESNVV